MNHTLRKPRWFDVFWQVSDSPEDTEQRRVTTVSHTIGFTTRQLQHYMGVIEMYATGSMLMGSLWARASTSRTRRMEAEFIIEPA